MEEIVRDLSDGQQLKELSGENLSRATNFKLYSKRAILFATFVGSPLAGGYLMKSNLLSLGQNELAKKVFTISTVSTFLILTLFIFLPESLVDKIPNSLFPAIYTTMFAVYIEKFMGSELKEHRNEGREFHSGWKAFGICLLALIPILVYIIALALVMPV